jgi:hypothetical protein
VDLECQLGLLGLGRVLDGGHHGQVRGFRVRGSGRWCSSPCEFPEVSRCQAGSRD